jgi:hypothetical protein
VLSKQKVIFFIKQRLGYPNVTIEKTDDDMWEYIRNFSIMEFSKYVPDYQEMVLDCQDEENKTADENMFLLHEPEGAQIMDIVYIPMPFTNMLINGWPYQAPITGYEQLPTDVQAVDRSKTIEHFSKAGMSWRFFPPNRLRINMGMRPDKLKIQYYRAQPESLYYIPYQYESEFLYLCLADIMTIIGNIRVKYTTLTTPFGEIPVNGDIAQLGNDLKDKVIQRLELLPPNALIYVD